MGETASKIKKLTSGAVQLLNSSDVVLANLMERSRVKRLEQQDFIQVIDTSKTSYRLAAADITDLIIDPNPPVAFAGNNQQLFRELVTDFFIEVVTDTSDDDLNLSNVTGETVTEALNSLAGGGGGPVIEDNITTVNTPTYTLLSSDYIIRVTVNCTITLPAVASLTIGQKYIIFARGVNVRINANPADLINNRSFVRLRNYEAFTLRALSVNEWAIGD